MRARTYVGSAGRHAVGATIEAMLIVAAAVALLFAYAVVAGVRPGSADPVLAAKGGNGGSNGKLVATISMADGARIAPSSTDVAFVVTRSIANDTVLWVTNKCFDADGAQLSSVDLPVLWGMWYSLEGTAGPFATDGTTCTAYVTLRPWQGRALGDAILTYAPAG